jgi:hypothetical protein
MLELNEKEKEAWDKQGWTPEGAAHVGAKDLGEALGIPIGRAATIIAECKGGGAKADEVERALAGDSDARAAVSRIVRGMPWVVLRNGQPDLAETRALVKDLKERPAQRSTWKGLLVVQPAAISSSTAKLPRCQITGNVLDDYDGKLVDGVTGADWSGIWVERGNSRILWLAHGPRSLIPAYAVSDPARAAKELAEPEVPMQWRRLEASFAQASPVEKAAAAERLFIEPAAEAFAQPAGDNPSSVSAQLAGRGLALCVLYTPSDHHFFETLRTHITPLLRQGAYHLVEEVAQAKVVALLVSPAMIADNLTYQLSERAANQPGCRLIPILVRAVGGMPPHLAPKRPLPFSGKVASGDAEWADVAAGLRQVADQMPVVMDRPTLRKRLDRVPDSDLVALCIDYFPEVSREFSSGMLKTDKISLLLQMIDPGKIAAALSTTRW